MRPTPREDYPNVIVASRLEQAHSIYDRFKIIRTAKHPN